MTIERNQHVFDFFRQRARFVERHDGIEAFVTWGPVVDAIALLRAKRLEQPSNLNWRCFQTALAELVSFIDLRTLSVPLLREGLRTLALSGNPEAAQIFGIVFGHLDSGLAPSGLIWTMANDLLWQSKIAAATTTLNSKPVQRALRNATYAGILYTEYRCPLVHGLDMGWRTWPGSARLGSGIRDDAPTYMNFIYSDGDQRPHEHRTRMRISFSQSFLVRVLHEMINREEIDSTMQGWIIPQYATRQ